MSALSATEEMEKWLKDHKLAKLIPKFKEDEIDLDLVREVTTEELEDWLDELSLGVMQKKKLRKAVKELSVSPSTKAVPKATPVLAAAKPKSLYKWCSTSRKGGFIDPSAWQISADGLTCMNFRKAAVLVEPSLMNDAEIELEILKQTGDIFFCISCDTDKVAFHPSGLAVVNRSVDSGGLTTFGGWTTGDRISLKVSFANKLAIIRTPYGHRIVKWNPKSWPLRFDVQCNSPGSKLRIVPPTLRKPLAKATIVSKANKATPIKTLTLTPRALANAIEEGSLWKVKSLLSLGVRANESFEGLFPLHRAVMKPSAEMLAALLEHGADVSERNAQGSTALLKAATIEDSYKCMEMLLEAGSDPNSVNSHGWTQLTIATVATTATGAVKTVKLLLDNGAEIDKRRTNNGATPLMCAATKGRPDVVRLLLQSGAQIDLKFFGEPETGSGKDYTALMLTVAQPRSLACVKVLLAYRADVCCVGADGKTARSLAPTHSTIGNEMRRLFDSSDVVEL